MRARAPPRRVAKSRSVENHVKAEEHAEVVAPRLSVLDLVEEDATIVGLADEAPPITGQKHDASARLQHEFCRVGADVNTADVKA